MNAHRSFHGRTVRIYDFLARTHLRRAYRRLAEDIAGMAPADATVLDIGTGPGMLLVELARRRPDLRLTGVDVSPDMVAAAGKNLRAFGERATVRVADVAELPFPDRSFDLIVSSFSLHHWDDPGAALPQLQRVLRSGGRVYIYDHRFAPFEALTGGRRTMVRTGLLIPRRCVRYEM